MTKAKTTKGKGVVAKSPLKALVVPHVKAARYVVGPDNAPLSLSDLPPTNTHRWVIRRKAEVILAVRGGLITLQDALKRWNISDEEYNTWVKTFDKHGVAGMRTTRIQEYKR